MHAVNVALHFSSLQIDSAGCMAILLLASASMQCTMACCYVLLPSKFKFEGFSHSQAICILYLHSHDVVSECS